MGPVEHPSRIGGNLEANVEFKKNVGDVDHPFFLRKLVAVKIIS